MVSARTCSPWILSPTRTENPTSRTTPAQIPMRAQSTPRRRGGESLGGGALGGESPGGGALGGGAGGGAGGISSGSTSRSHGCRRPCAPDQSREVPALVAAAAVDPRTRSDRTPPGGGARAGRRPGPDGPAGYRPPDEG